MNYANIALTATLSIVDFAIDSVEFTQKHLPTVRRYTVWAALVALYFTLAFGQRAIECGKLFRAQVEDGYKYGHLKGQFTPLACAIACDVEFPKIVPAVIEVACVASVVEKALETVLDDLCFVWTEKETLKDLRAVCKNLPQNRGYSRWTKQQCLEAMQADGYLVAM